MAGNQNLHQSRAGKTDEFYTQLSTIEDELRHYRHYFKDKVILCNADDPYESNFFKYFAMNFNALGLKKLIATCYTGSPVAGRQLSLFDVVSIREQVTEARQPYKIEITEVTDENMDGAFDLADVEYLLKNKNNVLTLLNGDGDFRSAECMELMQECDIIVTNPPFSLMKEYLPLLVNSGKQFLVLGNTNHAILNEIFHYFIGNQVWLGYNSGHFWFMVPDYYEVKETDFKIDEAGQKWRRMGNICWFTNLDIDKRHQPLDLYIRYTPEKYPKYDQYDAINVNQTTNIPDDYCGIMGVPITFLSKHSPEQFEIIGVDRYVADNPKYGHRFTINGKETYARILIRRNPK